MRLLRGGCLRLVPVVEAVTPTFMKVKARYRWIARKIFHRERQRLLDHAVDREAMAFRVDIGRAGVVPLEDEAVRRDDARLVLDRRHAPIGPVLKVFRNVGTAARDMRLELRRHAVRGLLDDATRFPVGRRYRQWRGARRAPCGERASGKRCGLAKKIPAPVNNWIFRHGSSSRVADSVCPQLDYAASHRAARMSGVSYCPRPAAAVSTRNMVRRRKGVNCRKA